jgi:hypothetical protein
MDGETRKAAVGAYKERKPAMGIYAVRCGATGQCWVGRAPDLAKIQNRLWFTLRMGNNPHRTLQQAWNAHGADAFAVETVEQLVDEDIAFARERLLKDRLAHWCAQLGAEAI